MANLMQDMASGSSAVLTMQQNMAAAPDVQQVQKNVMQEQALKIQQEQANLEKSRLNNMISESGYQASTEAKVKLQGIIKSDAWKNGKDADRLRMLANAEFETNNLEEGAKQLTAATIADAKEIATQQHKLDMQAQEIGNADSVLQNVPAGEEKTYFDNLPKPAKDAIIAQIGQANYDKMDGTQLKNAVHGLMRTAKGQLSTISKELDAKRQEKINENKIEVAKIMHNKAARDKHSGSATKEDLAATRLWETAKAKTESVHKKAMEAADKAVADAELQEEKSKITPHWYGDSVADKATDAAINKTKAARTARIQIQLQQLEEELDTASLLPKGSARDSIMGLLKKRSALLKSPTTGAPDKNKATSGSDTSNKSKPTGTKEAPVSMPSTKADLQKDKYYDTPKGVAKWDGEKFVKD